MVIDIQRPLVFFSLKGVLMRKAISTFLGMLVACVLATMFINPYVAAASPSTLPCKATMHGGSVTDMNFGTDVPVVLVHGIDGSPRDWTEPKGSSICDGINDIAGAHVVLSFSYTGRNWGNMAKSLRPFVKDIAEQSTKNGGSGKVVIVGYSLGTAITRTLFSDSSMNDKVGQVITIAAPDLDPFANFPSGIIVRAIAGDIFKDTVRKGKTINVEDTKKDGFIPMEAALKRFTDNPEIGGGRVIAVCTKTYKQTFMNRLKKTSGKAQDLCDHGNLLKNPVVTEGVVSGISAYVSSLPKDNNYIWLAGGSLTMPLNSSWSQVGFADMPDWGGRIGELGTSRTLVIQDTSKGDFCGGLDYDTCFFTYTYAALVKTGPGPQIVIDGLSPDYSASFTNNVPLSSGDLWCYTQQHVCLIYEDTSTGSGVVPSQTLLNLFATSTWSN